MDVAEPNFGTALTTPPGVVTPESRAPEEFGVGVGTDAIVTLGEELVPDTTGVVAWPEVDIGALKKAEAGTP
jgi:hypothetical protein